MQHTPESIRAMMEELAESGIPLEEVVMSFSRAIIKKADADLKKYRLYLQRKQYEERLRGQQEWRERRRRITNNYRKRKKEVDDSPER